MQKPYGAGEYDGYPMPNIPPDKKPLTKEEEDKIIKEMHERIRKRLAAENQEKRKAI